MEYLWLIAIPTTIICVFAAIAHASFMRAMMPSPPPDISDVLRNMPPPYETTSPQEWLARQKYKGETNA
jgi:hypothetical protein